MRWLNLLLIIASFCASADELHGKVVKITDGDTITVLDANRQQYQVRVAGIDAPERKQANYETSRQSLARLAFGKTVVVNWHKTDRWGRLVGKVQVDEQDVGLIQVRLGEAWWFRQYAQEQTAVDRAQYEAAETEARISRRGLWENSHAVPPWEWRGSKPPSKPHH